MFSKDIAVNEGFNHWITLVLKLKWTDVPCPFILVNDGNPSVPDLVSSTAQFHIHYHLELNNVTTTFSLSPIGHTVKYLVVFHCPEDLVKSLFIQIQAIKNPACQFWIILEVMAEWTSILQHYEHHSPSCTWCTPQWRTWFALALQSPSL